MWRLFHLCSTSGRQNPAMWNARKPLLRLKYRNPFHLFHQNKTYPRICTRQPRCRPVWAFLPMEGETPLPGKRAETEPRCEDFGKRRFSQLRWGKHRIRLVVSALPMHVLRAEARTHFRYANTKGLME